MDGRPKTLLKVTVDHGWIMLGGGGLHFHPAAAEASVWQVPGIHASKPRKPVSNAD
jgi:hypothetical protein